MATIKEIAEIVGVSSSAVSRVLNYDEGISVSDETREAIFATAEKIGYKKRVIYPKIENVALLYFVDHEDELEDVFYHGVKDEIIKQAKKMNIQLSIYDRKDGMDHVPKDLSAFIAIGWLTRKEINALYKRCKRGVFIGTSPDEKLFDAVKPNMDSFVTQMVDYFVEKDINGLDLSGAVIEILTPENLPWISGSGHFDRALHTMGVSMRSTFSFPRDLRWMMATAWEKNCLKKRYCQQHFVWQVTHWRWVCYRL